MDRGKWQQALPLDAMEPEEIPRFFKNVYPGADGHGCWNWKGALCNRGYPNYKFRSVTVKAHRLSFVTFRQPLEPGETVHHLCHNPKCVNPRHLQAMSLGDNVAEGNSRRAQGGDETESLRPPGEENAPF